MATPMASPTNSKGLDTSTSVTVSPQYEITAWMLVAAGYQLTVRSSSLNSVAPQGQGRDPLNYLRNEAYLRFSDETRHTSRV